MLDVLSNRLIKTVSPGHIPLACQKPTPRHPAALTAANFAREDSASSYPDCNQRLERNLIMSAVVVRWLRVVEHCRAIDAVMYSQISVITGSIASGHGPHP